MGNILLKASCTPVGEPQLIFFFPHLLHWILFYGLDVAKCIRRNNIMAYCCNVQNSCISSRLTKFNRALSEADRRHSRRRKKGTDFCHLKKKKTKQGSGKGGRGYGKLQSTRIEAAEAGRRQPLLRAPRLAAEERGVRAPQGGQRSRVSPGLRLLQLELCL